MRAAAALLALCVTGCADGIEPWQAPVAVTYAFKTGEHVICEETLVRIGLPTVLSQVIGFAKRTWECKLVKDKP